MNNNSYRDWLIITTSSFVVLLIFIFLSIYIFNAVDNIGSSDAVTQGVSNTKMLDRKALQNTVNDFSTKKLNFDELRKNPVHFDDPSL
ncbi:MAG: hypothetical protein AAB866_02530 [Patescibacteria group bacterium]